MEGSTPEELLVRGRSIRKKKGRPSSGRSKSRGNSKWRSTSPAQLTRRCWECGKTRQYKRDCKSKGVETNKDSKEIQLTGIKLTQEEKGDVYLSSTSTQLERDSWVTDTSASFHMTTHRNWFFEYKELKSGDVLLGDDSLTKIIG